MRKKASLALPVLAVLGAMLASCGGGATSGIIGIVVTNQGGMMTSTNLWSASPLPDGFGTSRDRPYRVDAVQVLAASAPNARKVVVAKARPNDQALFHVKLPPGSYVLAPLDHRAVGWQMRNGRRFREITGGLGQWHVTVRAGRWTRVVIALMRF